MYLYEKENNNIKIYTMIPNREKIYKFKKEQMNMINEDERVLKAVTNFNSLLTRSRDIYYYNASDVYKKTKLFDKDFHDLVSYETNNNQKQEMLLEQYYNSNFIKQKLAIIENLDKGTWNHFKYLLLTKEDYVYEKEKSKIRTMDNIIQINKDLYLL